MTIDERLDRLTQRHEALTQSVELLAHMQQEHERQAIAAHQRFEEEHRKTQVLLAQVTENIDRLANIALAHEHRISELESPPN
jgi:hypothetical protein